jgi:hypothetical protein
MNSYSFDYFFIFIFFVDIVEHEWAHIVWLVRKYVTDMLLIIYLHIAIAIYVCFLSISKSLLFYQLRCFCRNYAQLRYFIAVTRNYIAVFRNYDSQCDRGYDVIALHFYRNRTRGYLSYIHFFFLVRLIYLICHTLRIFIKYVSSFLFFLNQRQRHNQQQVSVYISHLKVAGGGRGMAHKKWLTSSLRTCLLEYDGRRRRIRHDKIRSGVK